MKTKDKKSPNDPKLSDQPGRESAPPSQEPPPPRLVRCSAWLGVAVVPDWVAITVASVLVVGLLILYPWTKAKTLEAELARAERVSWIALGVSLLALPVGLGLVRPMNAGEREKATREQQVVPAVPPTPAK